MKKIFTLATMALLVTATTFAGEGKQCAKGKACCSKKECTKKTADSKDLKATSSAKKA